MAETIEQPVQSAECGDDSVGPTLFHPDTQFSCVRCRGLLLEEKRLQMFLQGKMRILAAQIARTKTAAGVPVEAARTHVTDALVTSGVHTIESHRRAIHLVAGDNVRAGFIDRKAEADEREAAPLEVRQRQAHATVRRGGNPPAVTGPEDFLEGLRRK